MHLDEVAQRIATIVFRVRDANGADLTDVALTVDGERVADSRGTEFALDPGPHVFTFEHHGRTQKRTFVLLEREKGRRETIAFEPLVIEPILATSVPSLPTRPINAPETTGSSGIWRTIGGLTMGAGAVGLGIGTAFGIMALGKNADADCDARNICGDPRARHDARTAADISTASFITGGVLAVAGVTLFVLASTLGR